MEKVVDRRHRQEGASWSSYTVAGKTGTADKLVNGRYSASQQNVSFVGFVPSRNPALTVIVMIDSPRVGGDTGGAIAAPIFKRIAEAALRQLGVHADHQPGAAGARRAQRADAGDADIAAPRDADIVIAMPAHMTEARLVPDLRGMSAREALRDAGPARARPRGCKAPASSSIRIRPRRIAARAAAATCTLVLESPTAARARWSRWSTAVTLGDVAR